MTIRIAEGKRTGGVMGLVEQRSHIGDPDEGEFPMTAGDVGAGSNFGNQQSIEQQRFIGPEHRVAGDAQARGQPPRGWKFRAGFQALAENGATDEVVNLVMEVRPRHAIEHEITQEYQEWYLFGPSGSLHSRIVDGC